MARIILLILIGFAIYLLFRAYLRSQTRDKPPPDPAARSVEGEDMVRCVRCGVNLPRSESKEEAGQLVCAANPGCRHKA